MSGTDVLINDRSIERSWVIQIMRYWNKIIQNDDLKSSEGQGFSSWNKNNLFSHEYFLFKGRGGKIHTCRVHQIAELIINLFIKKNDLALH